MDNAVIIAYKDALKIQTEDNDEWLLLSWPSPAEVVLLCLLKRNLKRSSMFRERYSTHDIHYGQKPLP